MSQTADQIGHSFLIKYYTSLAEAPKDVLDMYSKDAYMAIPDADFSGHKEITDYINSIQPGRKYRIHKVGAYESAENSLVVVAKGTMLTRDESMVFNQTFVLVMVSENQYCIRNDILVDFQTVASPAPEPVVEEVVPEPEPVVEEVVPEPEPEVEEVVVEQAAPVPTPPTKAVATPPTRPVEAAPVKEEKAVECSGSDWASRLRRAPAKSEAPVAASKQVVAGGAVPRQQQARVREEPEKKRETNKPRTDRKDQFSIYVSMGTKDFKETDVEKLFSKYGRILGKTLKTDKQFAFVDFADKKSADAALAGAADDGIMFNGRAVRCQVRQEEKKAPAADKAARTPAVAARRK